MMKTAKVLASICLSGLIIVQIDSFFPALEIFSNLLLNYIICFAMTMLWYFATTKKRRLGDGGRTEYVVNAKTGSIGDVFQKPPGFTQLYSDDSGAAYTDPTGVMILTKFSSISGSGARSPIFLLMESLLIAFYGLIAIQTFIRMGLSTTETSLVQVSPEFTESLRNGLMDRVTYLRVVLLRLEVHLWLVSRQVLQAWRHIIQDVPWGNAWDVITTNFERIIDIVSGG